MVTRSDASEDLAKILINALGLPKSATSFSLHFAMGEPVRVSCFYYPENVDCSADLIPVLAQFELHPKTEA